MMTPKALTNRAKKEMLPTYWFFSASVEKNGKATTRMKNGIPKR